MQCPNCASTNLKVIDSRPAENNTSIRRRRECLDCGARFTTFERIERTPLLVVKRDGTREEFSHEKVLRGLIRSAEKRPVRVPHQRAGFVPAAVGGCAAPGSPH